jgi:hypothetical protein
VGWAVSMVAPPWLHLGDQPGWTNLEGAPLPLRRRVSPTRNGHQNQDEQAFICDGMKSGRISEEREAGFALQAHHTDESHARRHCNQVFHRRR